METFEFGTRLRDLRKRAGLSQRGLATKAGIDFSYLSKIESGAMPPPSEKVILRLAEVLNTDKDELLTLAGKVPSDIAQILKNREALELLRSRQTQKKIKAASKREGTGIMKTLFSYKYLSRVGIAIALICAIGASLWFSAPTPVRALEVTITPPSPGTLGTAHSFTMKVDIPNPELVPIQSIDMEIYNVNDVSKKMTCTNLPLTNNGSQNYSTAGGTVSVTASTTNWQWYEGTSSADWKGTGYSFSPPNVFGYGYQDIGTASITYSGTWTSPSGWPSGGYQIKVNLNAQSSTLTKTFTEYSGQFTLSSPVLAGGGGVGGAPKIPGITNLGSYVSSTGYFYRSVTAQSDDDKVKVAINAGTTGLTTESKRLSQISILPMVDPPAPPERANVVGLTYDLGPDGATFDPPVTLTLQYDRSLIQQGVAEKDLVIAYYDKDKGEWVELESVVIPETNTIVAKISHFTAFTVLAKQPAAPPPPPPPPPAPKPAAFSVSNLNVSPAKVETKETVTVTVYVANTGGTEGSYTVVLKINEVKEAEKSVTVTAGSSTQVAFRVSRETAGSYTIDVDGLSASFTVTAPPAPPTTPVEKEEVPEVPAPSPIAWWVWLIIAIVAATVIGLSVWLIAKRRFI